MFEKERFKALVHYAVASVEDPAKLGAVKLNKILWFSDVFAFSELGKAITGATYIKEKFGPIPRVMLPMLRELISEGRIRIDDVEYFGKIKKQYVSLVEANLNDLSDDERKIVDYVIRQITDGFTAAEISDLTHDDVWKLAEIGEEIPMQAMLASDLGDVTEADMTWVRDKSKAEAA